MGAATRLTLKQIWFLRVAAGAAALPARASVVLQVEPRLAQGYCKRGIRSAVHHGVSGCHCCRGSVTALDGRGQTRTGRLEALGSTLGRVGWQQNK